MVMADHDCCRVLGPADRPAMLLLTQIAFPDYFRERTADRHRLRGVASFLHVSESNTARPRLRNYTIA
jgi:hypothetical protein